MNCIRTLTGIFKYQLKLRMRYPLNFIMYIITIYIIFLTLFAGILKDIPIQRLILTFFLWSFSVAGYTEITLGIISEIKEGTIIQLFRSPCGYMFVITAINISSFVNISIISLIILFLMEITTHTFIKFNFISIAIILITVSSSYGIGLVITGLSLIHKEIRSFVQLINLLFAIAISLSPEKYPILKYIPISQGTYLMIKSIENQRLNIHEFFTLLLISFLYIAIGYLVFYLSMEKTRKDGTLSHY